MVDGEERKVNGKIIFGTIVGSLYLIFGFVQLINGTGILGDVMDQIYIPKDIIGGFVLIIIGLVFYFGVKELNSGIKEGVAYIFIGIFLALVFLMIYLLIMLANSVEAYLIISEDFIDWSPEDELKPGIYLGLISLIGFVIWRKKFKLTKK